MFVEEQVFFDAVTTELVDQCGLIKPLVSLILDFTLTIWTWNLETQDARDVAVLDATRNTIKIRFPPNQNQSPASGKSFELASSEPLRVGDRMMFVFHHVSILREFNNISILVKNETRKERINIESFGGEIMVDKSFCPVMPVTLHTFKNKRFWQVSGIVLSRDENQVRMRLVFLTKESVTEPQPEFQLSLAKANEILFPAIKISTYPMISAVGWRIALANAIEKE